MEDNYTITFNYHLHGPYKVNAFYPIINNGCCDKNFFLLTECKHEDEKSIYSCQCACGMWCTTGYKTEAEAVKAYRQMCEDSRKGGE